MTFNELIAFYPVIHFLVGKCERLEPGYVERSLTTEVRMANFNGSDCGSKFHVQPVDPDRTIIRLL